MKCKASVTFEYLLRPPQTHKIPSIEASAPGTIARRALNEAKTALKPNSWCSLVVVLERLDSTDSEDFVEAESENAETAN